MVAKSLFISLSPKLRKQLDLPAEKDEFSFYEALGISRNFSLEDLSRALNRSKELLERLKYNPKYRDEAAAILEHLHAAAEVLRNPAKRYEYDTALQVYFEAIKSRKLAKFRQIVELTTNAGGLSPVQKQSLFQFAAERDIKADDAHFIIDLLPTVAQTDAPPMATPPRLIAPVPLYQDTQAFTLILKKSSKRLNDLITLRCFRCDKPIPITHLACGCGALMRGKLVCLDCAALLPRDAEYCPTCGKEPQVMLELTPADISAIHRAIKSFTSRRKYCAAFEMCKDLLAVKPGDEDATAMHDDLAAKCREERQIREALKVQKDGLLAWQNHNPSRTYQLLITASEKINLSDEAAFALQKAAGQLEKRMRRITIILFIVGGLFALIGIASFFIWTMNEAIFAFSLGIVGLIMFVLCLLAGIIFLILSSRYRSGASRILSAREHRGGR